MTPSGFFVMTIYQHRMKAWKDKPQYLHKGNVIWTNALDVVLKKHPIRAIIPVSIQKKKKCVLNVIKKYTGISVIAIDMIQIRRGVCCE